MSGLHPAGIDEPRLVAFARELARTHVTVVTSDLPELRRFEIASALTDRVEEAAVSAATDASLAPVGRIGLMGISFSGGLAVVAAGRPRLRNHLSYVFALRALICHEATTLPLTRSYPREHPIGACGAFLAWLVDCRCDSTGSLR